MGQPQKPYPRHLGIILDGNRRYEKKHGLRKGVGHAAGYDNLTEIYDWTRQLGIKELTLYCFSIQNFNRPDSERSNLMSLMVRAAQDILTNRDIHENEIRVRMAGMLDMLPRDVRFHLERAEDSTKDYTRATINLCLAYGGQEEIVDAAKRLSADVAAGKLKPDDIDTEVFNGYLFIQNSPDLIIRTGGDRRTSNFLAWQSAYSEWFFLDKFWPEFTKQDLVDVIDEFMGREQRFGR